MGSAMSSGRRRFERRHPLSGYPGSSPLPEDVYSGQYMVSSYPVSPTVPTSPMDQMDLDPYFQMYPHHPQQSQPQQYYQQYQEYPAYGRLRRANSDPSVFQYTPYVQYGMYPADYQQPYQMYDQNQNVYGAYGYAGAYEENASGYRRGRWGSLPNLHDPYEQAGMVHLSKIPRRRPLIQKIFGYDSVAQRRNILKKLDQHQIDPFDKTAQWLMQSDQQGNRMR